MNGVEINKIKTIKNQKGVTVEWAKNVPGKQISVYLRKKGAEFANHYHTGSDPAKNPERFFLLSGKVEFTFLDLKTKKQETTVILPYHELLIYPNIYHSAKALEDSVFLEYRSTVFNPEQDDIHLLNT